MIILLNKPVTPDLNKLTKYLAIVNESGWYTNFGPLHQELTSRIEEYLGVENLLLVSNGTLALQVAYKTLNVTNALTTPFSFVATASSLIWQGIGTSFSDIDAKSFNLCPEEVKNILHNNEAIDTVVATHVYGNPCDVNAFDEISRHHNVKVIYDAAHAFGVKIGDKSVLNFGDASTLSFHATKVFHTVEGGAIVFKRKTDFERAKRLINFGLDTSGNITEAGINAKLNEYQCAVGLTLLDDIDNMMTHRSELLRQYRSGLKDVIKMPEWHENASFNGAYMPVIAENEVQLNMLIATLNKNNIQSRKYFSPSLNTVFNNQTKNINNQCNKLEISKNVTERVLCLPLHAYMAKNDVTAVINTIKMIFR